MLYNWTVHNFSPALFHKVYYHHHHHHHQRSAPVLWGCYVGVWRDGMKEKKIEKEHEKSYLVVKNRHTPLYIYIACRFYIYLYNIQTEGRREKTVQFYINVP